VRVRFAAGVLVLGLVLAGCAGDDSSDKPASQPAGPVAVKRHTIEMRPVLNSGTTPCQSPTATPGPKRSSLCFRLDQDVMATGDFGRATTTYDRTQKSWALVVTVNPESADHWQQVVQQYTNQQLAILVDGKVVSAPVLNPGITGTTLQISSDFTETEAKQIAASFPG
jgi:preprotein translocase subunit SecD